MYKATIKSRTELESAMNALDRLNKEYTIVKRVQELNLEKNTGVSTWEIEEVAKG